MLRGAIDLVTGEAVSGWLYAEEGSTRDRTVLAFLDGECVGAGRIDQLRPDLAKAGLGDGVLGFKFPIRLPNPREAARIVVRLEGSDASLLQGEARVAAPDGGRATPGVQSRRSEASLGWMLARGWLSQPEHDFLKFFGRLGVYDRSLRLPRRGTEGTAGLLDPETTAREGFEVYALEEIGLDRRALPSADALPAALAEARKEAGVLPVMALWGEGRGRLGVVEGSHLPNETAAPRDAGWTDYALGPDHLVFVDPGCRLQVRGEDVPGLVLFSARVRR